MEVPPSDEWLKEWLNVGSIIGVLAFGAVSAFAMLYRKWREDERSVTSASPIVANAIGAAFVDRGTAQDIAAIRDDVGAMRKIADRHEVHDEEDRIRRLAREEMELLKRRDET